MARDSIMGRGWQSEMRKQIFDMSATLNGKNEYVEIMQDDDIKKGKCH